MQPMQLNFRSIVVVTICLVVWTLSTAGPLLYRGSAGLLIFISVAVMIVGFVTLIVCNRIKLGVFFLGKLRK